MRHLAPACTLLALVLSGCLGAERTFPDESASTTGLRVNAYTDVHSPAPHTAIVELSGAGDDGEARAFRGDVVLTLALQEGGQAGPATYRTVKEWRLSLGAQDFASGTVPYYKHVIQASDIPQEGTYRASVSGDVGGRDLSASALFAYVRQGVPSVP